MKVKKIVNICNLYILAWCLYLSQGTLGVRGSIVSQLLLVFILAVSVFYTFYAILNYNIKPFLKTVIAFFTILSIYGVFLILGDERIVFDSLNPVNKISSIKGLTISILPIFPFYVFARRGMLTENVLKIWTWVLFIVCTLHFKYMHDQALILAMQNDSQKEEFTNNAGYLFLSLLPFTIFFRNKPQLQFAMIGYCMFFILSGFKRGAIIIGFLVLSIIIYDTIKHSKDNNKIKVLLLTGVLIALGIFAIQYFLYTSDYFNYRLYATLQGYSSGRDRLYSTLLNHFINDTTALQFLFGSGTLTSIKVAGNYAHNDWLELAVNQGLLGIVLYMVYWINAYSEWRHSAKMKSYSIVLLILFLSLFLQSLFSMSYLKMEFCTTMLIGYCLAQNHNRVMLRKIIIKRSSSSHKVIKIKRSLHGLKAV